MKPIKTGKNGFFIDFRFTVPAESNTVPKRVQVSEVWFFQIGIRAPSKQEISAIVVCINEEDNIRDCLESLKWCDEIVVVDSFSTDRTVEICRDGEWGRVTWDRLRLVEGYSSDVLVILTATAAARLYPWPLELNNGLLIVSDLDLRFPRPGALTDETQRLPTTLV
jgi:cellulose synthase/poly-beta-1,6-N-acetylglucosamine synthase-like glycosyltransferase